MEASGSHSLNTTIFVRDDIVPSSIVNRNSELTLTVTGSATASRFYGLTLRSHGPVNRWRGDDNFNMHLSSKDSKVNGTSGVQTCFSGRLNDNNTKESMHIEFSGDYLRSIDASPLEQDSTLILVVHPKMINEFEEQLVKRGLQNAFHREPYGAAEIDILVGDWVMQSEKDDSDRFLPITLKLLPTTHPEGATWSLPGMTPDSPLSDPEILIREKIQLLFQAFYLEPPDHGPNEPQALTALYGVHMCARELPFNLLHVELTAAEHSLSIAPDLSPYNVDLIQAQRLLKTVRELLPPFTCIPNTADCFPTLSDSSVLVEFGDKETIMKIYPLEYHDNAAKEFHWKDRSHYVGVVINENSQPLLVVTDEFAGKARELLRVEYVHNDEKRAMIPSMVIAESEADEQNLQIHLLSSPHRN